MIKYIWKRYGNAILFVIKWLLIVSTIVIMVGTILLSFALKDIDKSVSIIMKLKEWWNLKKEDLVINIIIGVGTGLLASCIFYIISEMSKRSFKRKRLSLSIKNINEAFNEIKYIIFYSSDIFVKLHEKIQNTIDIGFDVFNDTELSILATIQDSLKEIIENQKIIISIYDNDVQVIMQRMLADIISIDEVNEKLNSASNIFEMESILVWKIDSHKESEKKFDIKIISAIKRYIMYTYILYEVLRKKYDTYFLSDTFYVYKYKII